MVIHTCLESESFLSIVSRQSVMTANCALLSTLLAAISENLCKNLKFILSINCSVYFIQTWQLITRKPVGFQLSCNMHMYYAFVNHIYTFSSVLLMYSLFGRHISFSLFRPINLTLYTCVSIHNINAYSVLSDSHRYFHLASIFVLWQLHIYMHTHICMHT